MKQYTLLFLILLISMPLFVKTKNIDQPKKFEINTSQQWVLYRGNNIDKPIVLFIHGGASKLKIKLLIQIDPFQTKRIGNHRYRT